MRQLSFERHSPWPSTVGLLLVFALALAVRVPYAFLAPDIDPFLHRDPLHADAKDYDQIARNLVQGHGFSQQPPAPTSFRAPLYPFFLGAIYWVLGHSILIARLAQALVGALLAPIVFLLADRLFDRPTALLAGVGTALHPLLIYFGAWLITDTLFITVFTAVIWQAVCAVDHPSRSRLFWLGTTLGLATLTRPQAILILPMIGLWFFLTAPGSTRQKAAHILVIALMTALPLIPWTIRNYAVHGEWFFISTQGGFTFYGAHNPDAFGGHVPGFPPVLSDLTEPQADREYYRRAFLWIRENPQDFLELLPKKFVRLWSPMQVNTFESESSIPFGTAVRWLYAIFLLLALYGGLRSTRRSVVLWFPIISFTLAGLIYYGGTRYALPTAPSLVVLAASGLMHVLTGPPGLQRFRFVAGRRGR